MQQDEHYKHVSIISDGNDQDNNCGVWVSVVYSRRQASYENKTTIFNIVNNRFKFVYLILLFASIFQVSYSTNSVPIVYDSLANIQSAVLSMTISSGSYYNSYNYTYQKSKRSQPVDERIFLGVYQMDYNINNPVSFGGYKLYYEVYYYTNTASGIRVYIYYEMGYIMLLKISLLVFDNDFYQFDQIFYADSIYFSYSSSSPITYSVNSSTYTVLRFLVYCYVRTANNTQNTIKVSLAPSLGSSSFSITPVIGGASLSYGYARVRILVVYPQVALKYSLIIESQSIYTITPPYMFTFGLTKYSLGKTVHLMGLQRFQYVASQTQLSQSFKWSTTYSSNTTHQMVVQTTVNTLFKQFRYSYLIINYIYCPVTHPLRGTNRVSSAQQCFDVCYQNQFVQYDTSNLYLKCSACLTSCKTCETSTTCSSCFTGFDLDPTTFQCIVSPSYYDDGSGNIILCDNALTGCLTCANDGSSCSFCKSDYYLSGTTCAACSTVVTQCSKCNSTHCFDCLAPKVLINSTFCSDPISSQLLPGPNQVIGPCTDSNCLQCDQKNRSLCLMCQSNLFQLINGKCSTVCGDSLIDGTDICDDGNNVDYDGCSSDCLTVQDGFACDKVPSVLTGYDTSECYFNRTIKLNIISIQKSVSENKVSLFFKNSELKINAWQHIQANNELTPTFSLKIPKFESGTPGYYFNYNASFVRDQALINKLKLRIDTVTSLNFYSETRYLQTVSSSFLPQNYEYIMLDIFYSQYPPGIIPSSNNPQSLNHQIMSLTFNPVLSQRKIFTRSTSSLQFNSDFTLKADDNQVIQYYSSDYYTMASQIKFMAFIVSIVCILMVFIGLVSYCIDGRNSKQMLIALEASFIVQLTYFSIIGIGQLNPLFISMAEGLKYSSGYELSLSTADVISNRELIGIGVNSTAMMNNVNVSFILVLICVFIGGIALLLDKFFFSKKNTLLQHQNQQQRQQAQVKSHQEKQDKNVKSEDSSKTEKSKCYKIGMFLIFNAGFGLFLFFLYKYLFYTMVEFKYQKSQIAILDFIIMGCCMVYIIFYTILLILRIQYFQTFTQKLTGRRYKINTFDTLAKNKQIPTDKIKNIQKRFAKYIQSLPESQKSQILKQVSLQAPQQNIKLKYFIVILVEHLINIISCVFVSDLVSFFGGIMIFTYLLNLVLLYKSPIYPSSNLYRLNFTQTVGVIIQSILLARRIMAKELSPESVVGKSETSLGIYFAFSIISLLLILCLLSFVYVIYGIKRIRCCELQLNWQNIQMNSLMKTKLEQFVIQQLNDRYKYSQNQKLMIQIKNGQQFQQSVGQSPRMLNKRFDQTSFNSDDSRQFFHLHKQAKQIIYKMITPNGKNKFLSKSIKDQIYLDSQINQQVTLQSLKKQIRQKLLNSRLQRKIKKLAGLKEQSSNKVNTDSYSQQNIQSKSQNKIQSSTQQKYNSSNKTSNKNKPQMDDFQQKILLKNMVQQKEQVEQVNDEQLGYLYTDAKIYNLYEQFDMI